MPVLLSVAGFFGLVLQPHSSRLLFVLFTVALIGSSYLPLLWSIPTEYLSKSAAAAAVGMINLLAACPVLSARTCSVT